MEMVHFLCNIPRRVQEYNPITAPGFVGWVNLRHTPLVFLALMYYVLILANYTKNLGIVLWY